MQYSSYHMYQNLTISFGSPFGSYLTFHALTKVGQKSFSVCLKNVPVFRALVKLFYDIIIFEDLESIIIFICHIIFLSFMFSNVVLTPQ